jgi:DNA ligase-1
MLAKPFKGQDIVGWLMSEKLDGVRAIWTGEELLSRNGKKFFAPEWFTEQLPNEVLDGELFIGRGMFQKTIGTVRKKTPIDSEWKAISYQVFDVPEFAGKFKERIAYCHKLLATCAVAEVVHHEFCSNAEHMQCLFNELIARGAEGVMLRNPESEYEGKRSGNLLKVKQFFSEEAIVTGYQDGEGKHEGRLGALLCEWNGVKFKLGTGFSDVQRGNPPELGALVTFNYQELTDGGVPRFPVFIAVRDYEGGCEDLCA